MKIHINTLNEGINEFHFKSSLIEMGFEDDAEKMEIFPGAIFVDATVNKIADRYDIESVMTTQAHFICDRCLEEFDQKLVANFRLYVVRKLEEGVHEEDDEYRVLDHHEQEIDIDQNVMESLLLEVPMKRLCSEDCKGLCPRCGANLNYETCNCHIETIDPRFEKLRDLLFDNDR